MSRANRPAHRTFGRLSLESLESRLNPADFWWDPVYGSLSTDPRNWLTGPGVPYARYQLSDPPPGPNDHLYFLGGLSSADCTIPQPADPAPTPYGQAFAGLHLLFGPIAVIVDGPGLPGVPLPPPPPPQAYTGTVTAAGSFTVGTLEVDCGQIKQADPNAPTGTAGTLTVKTTLDWTGGTLNSNTVGGTIALAPGASGIAEPSFTSPGINGTVKLGSDLILQGTEASYPLPSLGSTLSMIGGTFEVYNGSAIVAEAYSTLNLIAEKADTADPVASLTIDGKENTEVAVKVKPKSKAVAATTRGSGDADDPGRVTVSGNKGGSFENSGTTEIINRTHLLILSGPDDENGTYTQKAAANQGQVVPVTTLETGSAVTCGARTGTFIIETGKLEITNRMVGGQATADDTATITAEDAAVWADGIINMQGIRYNILRIEGKFGYMGEIRLAVSKVSNASDLIVVTGKVTVTKTTAKLTLRWGDSSLPLTLGQRQWLLIKSETDTISDDLDSTRIDVADLDHRITSGNVGRSPDNKELGCDPYLRPDA